MRTSVSTISVRESPAAGAGKFAWTAALAVVVLAALLLGGLAALGGRNRGGRPAGLRPLSPVPGPAAKPGQGTIVFQSRVAGAWQIFSLDLATGSRNRLTRSATDDVHPSVSPDGAWIAFGSARSGSAAVWRMRPDGTAAERLTEAGRECHDPCWTADGTSVLYSSRRSGRENIFALELATRRERQISSGFWRSILPSVSPDGSAIAFARNKLGWDVYRMNADGSGVVALTAKGGNCRPDWSPDGRRIAYVSDVGDGKGDVWTMDAAGKDKRRVTFADDSYDYNPAWSPDGRWIVYETTTGSKRNRWSLAVIPAHGGTPLLLTPAGSDDRYPDWAPERRGR